MSATTEVTIQDMEDGSVIFGAGTLAVTASTSPLGITIKLEEPSITLTVHDANMLALILPRALDEIAQMQENTNVEEEPED